MVSKEICKKVHKIVQLALEISTTTEADVFVNYSPHVGWIEVAIFKHGWRRDRIFDKRYACKFDYLNGDPFVDYASFDKVIADLESLKRRAEKLLESEVKSDEHS